jgi:hypothetical protein
MTLTNKYLILGLFSDAFQLLESMWKVAVVACFKVLSQYFPGGTEKDRKEVQDIL